ncbi:MAG: ABC transporter permease [Acidobacteriota bacterium]
MRILEDFRFAFRVLRKHVGFTLVVLASLAVGIGANSAVFSFVNWALWRPLPHVEAPQDLSRVFTVKVKESDHQKVSYLDFLDYRQSGIFEDLTVYRPVGLNMAIDEMPEFVFGNLASANYFEMLGVELELGRPFLDGEENDPLVVLSHRFWAWRFGSDPDVIGRNVRLNGQHFSIIGVAPAGFFGTEILLSPDFWIPIRTQAQVLPSLSSLEDRGARGLRCTARHKPGTSQQQIQDRLKDLSQRLAEQYPDSYEDLAIQAVPESEARIEIGVGRVMKQAATALLVLVALVLLMTCANVANMLLARAIGRQREISIRLAMGAKRRRIVRQLLTESTLLAVLGGALGLLIAYAVSYAFTKLPTPPGLPIGIEAPLDLRVLLFSLAVSIFAGVVFGLVPALQISRPDLILTLKERGQSSGGTGRWSVGSLLIAGQVAISLVLLISAGLLLRSLGQAQSTDIGMDPNGVLTLALDLDAQGYSEDEGQRFYRELLDRLRAFPGVVSASLASPVQMGWSSAKSAVVVEGQQSIDTVDKLEVGFSIVAVDYFETVKTSIVEGRSFERSDTAEQPLRVIVNETFVERYWSDREVLGQVIRVDALEGAVATVVGVAEDGKYRLLTEAPRPFMYFAHQQFYSSAATLLVRTAGDPTRLTQSLSREIYALDDQLVISNTQPLETLISGRTLLPLRLVAATAGAFGLLGALLAAIGLYGIMSFSVLQRRREIGIRMAIGAEPVDVLSLVLQRGVALAVVGLTLGILLALAVSQLLAGLLVGVGALDPMAFAASISGLLLVTLAASLFPSLRALAIDPVRTLNAE